jgi:hypothetical protein
MFLLLYWPSHNIIYFAFFLVSWGFFHALGRDWFLVLEHAAEVGIVVAYIG